MAEDSTTEARSGARVLFWFNLMLTGMLAVGVAGITIRLIDSETDQSDLRHELSSAREDLQGLSQARQEALVEVSRRTSEVRQVLESERMRESQDWQRRLALLNERLEQIEDLRAEREAVVVADVRERIDAMRSTLESKIVQDIPTEQVFREFEHRHRAGIVLIYTEFDYVRREKGRRDRHKTVTGWGTGFFASEEGHIITNKHVIYPWKFDADLAAMEALGEININRASLRISAWRAGEQVLDASGEPMMGRGFNTHIDGNLRIAASAADSMREEKIELGSFNANYRVHELNDQDLVVLKAEGGPFEPLPLARDPWKDRVDTLDPVVAIGFPRGKKGLEGRSAVPSASPGAVRKVENTIHITAPIIPGNSGGPLIGPQGRVVGVVTRIYSETLGICIKVQRAIDLVDAARKEDREAAALAKKAGASRIGESH
jgi:S1-C subfamily serine protease